MKISGLRFPGRSPLISRRALSIAFMALVACACRAQPDKSRVNPVDPLPQDTGAAGLNQTMIKLQTTARLLQVVAHPDDEDGGMLTLEARGKGVQTVLLTLNRGEGGQNKVGSNLFDVLGVLRTLEVTAADRYYGVEQRFTRVADFGFSKNPDETFQKWNGHDVALADMVRVIRTFRPDVIAARFSGTERDGHGHHQASAILAQEAFQAAADPKRFPEQIQQGLPPWQAKKMYIGNVCGFGASSCPDADYTIRLNTGAKDPSLGESYIQFAMDGLKHQLSQGAGAWSVEPGDRFTYYKLANSVLPRKNGHETDFFEGIDTSLPSLADQAGDEVGKISFLRPALGTLAEQIKEASSKAQQEPSKAAEPLFTLVDGLRAVIEQVEKSDLSPPAKFGLLRSLREKEEQADHALNLAMGVTVDATVAAPNGEEGNLPSEADALTVASPGQRFTVRVRLHNGSKFPIVISDVVIDAPDPSWIKRAYSPNTDPVKPGQDRYANFFLEVPPDAEYTRPYWHRDSPETDAVNKVDDERYATLAFPPPQLHARAQYRIADRSRGHFSVLNIAPGSHQDKTGPEAVISSTIQVPFSGEKGGELKRTLAIAPIFSVMLDPGQQVIPVGTKQATKVVVAVSCNLSGASRGVLRLEAPEGWKVDPEEQVVDIRRRGERQEYSFNVVPANEREGRAQLRAVLEARGKPYSEGYSLVSREDLNSFYYYQPALQRVSIVDVKVPKDLKVAYVMGAGDDIPTVLKQLGLDVTVLSPERVAGEDLSKYATLVLGIRVYDTRKDVAANNKKLLDFVAAGGTLLVQYNAGTGDFNSGKFTPYPAQLGRGRVSVEEALVEILAPNDSIFHSPNQITQRDFQGWVQERGLYFMQQWDDHYKPLLSSHDPGETDLKGGLLRAQYGKGTYIYTGYSFFRQLPAGVPGAIRLYVDLLNAGH